MKTLYIGLLTFLMFAITSCTPSTPKVDIEAERTAIRTADAEWAKTAAAKDADGFTSFMAENGAILPTNAPTLTGAEAIKKWMSEMMANPGFAVTWQPGTVEVSAAGDFGYSLGTYELKIQDPAGNTVADQGKYITIWKKQADGKWKVAADIFNSDLPAAPAKQQ